MNAESYRRACEIFVVANLAKPDHPEVASIISQRIAQLWAEVASWSDEQVYLTVTDAARRRRFRDRNWGLRTVRLEDIAVWPGMGGLPLALTHGSVVDTARRIQDEGIPKNARRLRALVDAAERDPVGIERVCRALPLIAVEYSVLREEHPHSVTWVLDDGSHRAAVLALISSRADADVLIGIRKESG